MGSIEKKRRKSTEGEGSLYDAGYDEEYSRLGKFSPNTVVKGMCHCGSGRRSDRKTPWPTAYKWPSRLGLTEGDTPVVLVGPSISSVRSDKGVLAPDDISDSLLTGLGECRTVWPSSVCV